MTDLAPKADAQAAYTAAARAHDVVARPGLARMAAPLPAPVPAMPIAPRQRPTPGQIAGGPDWPVQSAPPIAVIGANGYLGRHVVRALGRAGMPAVGLHRSPVLAPAGVEFQSADLADPAQAGRRLAPFTTVVNCAHGGTTQTRRLASNLATWLAQAPQRRLIHVSSLAVFGQEQGCLTEATLPIPRRGHRYAQAKLLAERTLLPADQSGGRCLVLRLGCLYGPSAPDWFDRIARLLVAGRLGDLGALGNGVCPLLHVQDAATAIARAAMAPTPPQGVLHLLHPQPIRWGAYIAQIARAIGLSDLPQISAARLLAEAWLLAPLGGLARLTGAARGDAITPHMAALLRSRAHHLSRGTPLLTPAEFTPHALGIAEAARAFHDSNLAAADGLPMIGRPA